MNNQGQSLHKNTRNAMPQFDSERTLEEKALNTITMKRYRSPIDGSTERRKMSLPVYLRKENERKRKTRDALIYKFHLESEDKEKSLAVLAEKWGLVKSDGTADESRVRTIITTQRKYGVRIAALASEIESIRLIRKAQIVDKTDEYMNFLELTLLDLLDKQNNGTKFIDVQIETVSVGVGEIVKDKKTPVALSTKTKQIPINAAIKNTYDQIEKLFKVEAETLKEYDGAPANVRFQKSLTINVYKEKATKEFTDEFKRMMGGDDADIIDTTAVDVSR